MRISVSANFERRLGLFPAGLDRDGILFCNQNFADYPLEIPEGKFDPRSVKPKWMLLSYKKSAVASSYREGHETAKALDEDIRSCWCAKGSAGEWYRLDLGDVYAAHGIQLDVPGLPASSYPKQFSQIVVPPASTSDSQEGALVCHSRR